MNVTGWMNSVGPVGGFDWGPNCVPEAVEYENHIYMFGHDNRSGKLGTEIVCHRYRIDNLKHYHHYQGDIFAEPGAPLHTVVIDAVVATRDRVSPHIAHVVFGASGSALYYASLNLSTGVWSATETVATATPANGFRIFCAANGSVIVYGRGPDVKVQGTDRLRIGVWRRNSGTWDYTANPADPAGQNYTIQRAAHDLTDDSIYIKEFSLATWKVTLSGTTMLWTPITNLTYHGGGFPQLWHQHSVEYIDGAPWFFEAQEGDYYPKYGFRELTGAGSHVIHGTNIVRPPSAGIKTVGCIFMPTVDEPTKFLQFLRVGPTTDGYGFVEATTAGYDSGIIPIPPGNFSLVSPPAENSFTANALPEAAATVTHLSYDDGTYYVITTSQGSSTRQIFIWRVEESVAVNLEADFSSPISNFLGSLRVGGPNLIAQLFSPVSNAESYAIAGTFEQALTGLAYGVSPVPRGALERFLIRADIDGQNVPLVSLTIRRSLQVEGNAGLDAVQLSLPYTPALLAALRAAQGQQIAIRAIHESPNGETAIRTLGTYPIQQVRRIGGSGRITVLGTLPATYVIDDTPVQIRKVMFENANQLRAPIDYQLFPGQAVIGTAGAMLARTVTLYMDAETRLANMEISAHG